MSAFQVRVRKIASVIPHPKADRLDLVRIDDYLSAIPKGSFKEGDLAVYLPEAAMLPEFVLRVLNLWDEERGMGKCAGEIGARIKAVKLRGILSQGIVYPLSYLADHPMGAGWYLQDADAGLWPVQEGDDVANLLQITKHVPEVPKDLAGAAFSVGRHLIPNFDIEDIKRYPGVFVEGEEVRITEKLHGICTLAVLLPEADAIDGERFFVTGKRFGYEGLAYLDNEANQDNMYLKMVHQFKLREKVEAIAAKLGVTDVPVFAIGETFGRGVQDLGYDMPPTYRCFDIGTGYRGREQYLDYDEARALAESLDLQWTPELYRGPFSQEILAKVITGKETLTGKGVHIREGGVVHPVKERQNSSLEGERVILKAISPDYLSRPGNTTEYQ